ncbi:uncharacterized protein LDX57_008206 [Aspergillus melleus]|uniref:uncharacterized protein n=1 Tax=Aspergillus melleus TaxID=138277 RepID=UPI001E8D0850|nr:uncharacterized protein LDX57_008206 [Aspergillus melleus]KAH8430542.1 hypothetical protein LDX57_008206 [Aspergillus melleus]
MERIRHNMKLASITSRALCSSPRVRITIEFNNPKQSYTTGDQIGGTITVAVVDEITFDDISITLEGSSRVALLRPVTENREIKASHTFLRLQQPMDKAEYPPLRTFIPGRSYTYPFTFVIPSELPLGSCIHNGEWGSGPQRHAGLPPSMHLENLFQELCRISYLIRATVPRQGRTIAISTRTVRFTPTLPPGIQASRSYRYPTEMIVGKISLARGQLAVLAATPQLIQCCSLTRASASDVDKYVCMQVRFDPVGDAPPPRLRAVYPTLNALTTFSAALGAGQSETGPDPRYQGAHVGTTALPSVDLSSARWARHTFAPGPGPLNYHGPVEANSHVRKALSGANELYYTVSIAIPVAQLGHRDHVPTFHSCLASRIYLLSLTLSYNVVESRGRRAMKLQVPLELCTASDHGSELPLQDRMGMSKPSQFGAPPPPYSGQSPSLRVIPFTHAEAQAHDLPGYSDTVT